MPENINIRFARSFQKCRIEAQCRCWSPPCFTTPTFHRKGCSPPAKNAPTPPGTCAPSFITQSRSFSKAVGMSIHGRLAENEDCDTVRAHRAGQRALEKFAAKRPPATSGTTKGQRNDPEIAAEHNTPAVTSTSGLDPFHRECCSPTPCTSHRQAWSRLRNTDP